MFTYENIYFGKIPDYIKQMVSGNRKKWYDYMEFAWVNQVWLIPRISVILKFIEYQF